MLVTRAFGVFHIGEDVDQPVLAVIRMENDRIRFGLFPLAGGKLEQLDLFLRRGIILDRPHDRGRILHHEESVRAWLRIQIERVMKLVMGKGPL